jgi:hypothetical protein
MRLTAAIGAMLVLSVTLRGQAPPLTVTSGDALNRMAQDGVLTLSHARIEGPIRLQGALHAVTFDDVQFSDDFTIYIDRMDATFNCHRCRFDGDVLFPRAFLRYLKLFDTSVKGRLRIDHGRLAQVIVMRTIVGGSIDGRQLHVSNLSMYDVQFSGANFLGAEFDGFSTELISTDRPVRIRWEQFGKMWIKAREENAAFQVERHASTDVVEAQRLATDLVDWRTNFEALGYRSDAFEVRAEYERYRRDALRLHWTERWASILLGLPNRYGSRPLRPFWIAVWTILLFGVIYWVRDPFVADPSTPQSLPSTPRSLFAVCYSIDTFLPFVNVTGVKDWGWRIDAASRWLVTLEQMLGLTLTAMAAYSVTLVS